MRKIHCLNPISKLGTGLLTENYEMTDNLAEAEGILVRSAAMHDLELPKGLRAVARAGAGVNNIPLDKCAEAGVVVFNTPGANKNGVKELVLAGLFLTSRDVVGGIEWCREHAGEEDISKKMEKSKKAFAGNEIRGKKLGVIGLGAIGCEVANAAAALGMEVYGYDPFISVNAAWMLSRSVKHIMDVNRYLIARNVNPLFGSLSGYFRWSFADERFTLWQRTDYNSDMCFSHRILDMPFCMLAARDKENDERVFN